MKIEHSTRMMLVATMTAMLRNQHGAPGGTNPGNPGILESAVTAITGEELRKLNKIQAEGNTLFDVAGEAVDDLTLVVLWN